jgi:hypothetical protein
MIASQGLVDLVTEIKKCESAGATAAAVAMAFICVDTMAFLSMPTGQTSQTRADFIAWVDRYLKGHPSQTYQYRGIDVYAARCGLLHAFTAEADLHRRDPAIRMYGYHDGGRHAFNASISPNLVIIGTASFLNDVTIAVGNFLQASTTDADLRARVESRLPMVYATMPFPGGSPSPARGQSAKARHFVPSTERLLSALAGTLCARRSSGG